METGKRKAANYYMRLLHRYTGFFLIGFVVMYALSGIVLIYRDSDFMKQEKKISATLPVSTPISELGAALKIRDLKVIETNGNTVRFQNGTYDISTGAADYTVKELIFPFNKITALHKTPSKNPLHWFTLIFGILILFMALSSFWMLGSRSSLFRNGIITILTGLLLAVILVLFIK